MIQSQMEGASGDGEPIVSTSQEHISNEANASGFRSLGLNEDIATVLDGLGYETPTPIQAETIPLLLDGKDVLGQAQTGTGKTAAFALPLLQRIDVSKKSPQVLVLTPTRELAIQVAESFEKYAGNMRGLNVTPIYGGQDYQIQFRQLHRGPQVVVGTPGRVMDHMRRESLNLDDLQCLVLDEADEMLRMGFAEDVDWVLTQAPKKRQMALFSATMPGPIRRIAQQHQTNPSEITIAQRAATADTVNQRYIIAGAHQKEDALTRILEAEPTDGVLVFVKMRCTTETLADSLLRAGYKVAALNGDVNQNRRERIVENLRSGRIDIIVATDVAARGLDVQRISHVINYDPPHDSEAYVHRIGRTGRAGRSGEAILFVHPRERRSLHRLEQTMRQTIEPMDAPSNRAINKQRVARFHEKITEALQSKELETYQSIIQQYQRDNDTPAETLAAALAILANGDTPLLVKGKMTQASFANDSKRGSRDSRSNRGSTEKRHPKSRQQFDASKDTYRIEVGRQHKVQPGNIVGAIANEAGISNSDIGRINIQDRYSTVDLPTDFPQDLLDLLANVYVSGRKLQISRYSDTQPRDQESKRPYKKSKPKHRQNA